MDDQLKWKRTRRLGMANFLEELATQSQRLVTKELEGISGKLTSLKQMGVIKDVGQLTRIQDKIKELQKQGENGLFTNNKS